jgi:hypothetical protein
LNLTDYIIDFLAGFHIAQTEVVCYDTFENSPSSAKIIIIPAIQDYNITVLPVIPLQLFDGIPLLFGIPRIMHKNGKLIIQADIIASTFFLLSRYEELLKPKCRDQHGRFCGKDSIIFQQGYGSRPLVDEYGSLLRKWLKEIGVVMPPEKKGFNKIYLTHDIDVPFQFERFIVACKQFIKNIISCKYSGTPFKKYFNECHDDFYTFPTIINYDNKCKEKLFHTSVESIYFLISSGSLFNRKYYNFTSQKINRLIRTLEKSGATFGLHLSYEAGINPRLIPSEISRLKKTLKRFNGFNRYHFLQWREPEDVIYMEQAGITDDFTLSYADAAGFRVGTCRPYQFINPRTKMLTNVMIHPLEIMECTLAREMYMNLDYEQAFEYCKKIINQVYKHHGELVLLWHNNEFRDINYQEKLYKNILDYIMEF